MPTYEYSCQKCGKTFEMFQSMKDAPIKICTCGKKGKVDAWSVAAPGSFSRVAAFTRMTTAARRP